MKYLIYILVYFTWGWKAWVTWQRTITHVSWEGLTSQHSASVRTDERCKEQPQKKARKLSMVWYVLKPNVIEDNAFEFPIAINTAVVHQFCSLESCDLERLMVNVLMGELVSLSRFAFQRKFGVWGTSVYKLH